MLIHSGCFKNRRQFVCLQHEKFIGGQAGNTRTSIYNTGLRMNLF